MTKQWEKYEEVATRLLSRVAAELGLESTYGKQLLPGSDTNWEVGAVGVTEGGQGTIVIEVRRVTSKGQTQKDLAALAFQIEDLGAKGGIIVSPLPLQSGAKKIADAKNILEVTLNANATVEEFVMRFLNKVMLGVVDRVSVRVGLSGGEYKRVKHDRT